MKTMPMTTTSLKNITSCWLYQDHRYKYVEKGHIISLLPKVDLRYKPVLDRLGISYRKDAIGLGYEIWDPTCYEEESVTLPLFIQIEKSFRMLKKYTGTIVTSDTTKAAFALFEQAVKPEIDAIKEKEKERELISSLKTALNGNAACGIDCNRHFDLRTCNKKSMALGGGGAHFMVLPVHTLMTEKKRLELAAYYEENGMNPDTIQTVLDTDYIAIFDMTKLSTGATVDLYVPAGTEAMFVGRGGWQVKEWCDILGGLLKINVKAAK